MYVEIIVGPWSFEEVGEHARHLHQNQGPTMISTYTVGNCFIAYFDIVIFKIYIFNFFHKSDFNDFC